MEGQDLIVPDSFLSTSNSISSSNHERNIFCEATMSLQKFSTHPLDSSNPKWNTSMQFQIYDLNKDFLSVTVYDRKTFSPNTLLGKTELKILQIYREQMKENQQNNPIIRVFKINNEHHGKLMLKMSISIYK
jgi:Ca2+-dependent lipid-binding protein